MHCNSGLVTIAGPTDELLVLYALEEFLTRLSQSRRRDGLILKGDVLGGGPAGV